MGIGQVLGQLDPSQQTVPTIVSDSSQTQIQPSVPPTAPSTGYASDISSPAALPINSPFAPGSTGDLENRAAQSAGTLGSALQQQQPQQPQQQGGFSPNNPYAPIAQDYQNRWQATLPKPATGGPVKRILSSFFNGLGGSMMLEAGLTPPDVRNQQLLQHATTMMQLANQWEEMQGMMRYREALTGKMQQDAAFEAQMQPLRIQAEQQAVAAGQQAATTVHPAMSAADLKSLGVPDDLAAQYEGHQLTSADFAALKDLSAAGQTRIFDYGQDGTGQGKGQWLVDRNYNAIKQLSPISETARATALAKQQFSQQQALLKGMQSPVYAYDPQQKATILTTLTQANQGGMQAIRGVKESDIAKDTHDTNVLNDVAIKANNVMDAASGMDSWDPLVKQATANILSNMNKDSNLEIGAFGTRFPTASLNAMMNSESWHALASNPQAQKYVMGVLSLREASMGLQRVLTGSARANESQIAALQATLPGLEISGDLVGQKLNNFTQNIDMLRQGIPRMAGIDVVPVKKWSGPQTSALQSTGQQQGPAQPGGPINTGAGLALSGVSALTALGSRVRKSLGLE